MIYLDNAATGGKKPQSVIDAVNFALRNYCVNPGRGGYKKSIELSVKIFKIRENISDFFGAAGPQNVVFCANCTTALNYVIKGNLQRDDHVIISDLEHNAVLRPLAKTVDRYSKACVSFENDDDTVDSFAQQIRPDTKMIICTASSNVTGKILPLKKIGRLCKEQGIIFCVDAAQGGGVIPINMKEMNIDYLCLASHKGLFAPMGTGVLIAGREIEKTVIEGGNGIDSLSENQAPYLPEGFESGTVAVPAIFGIGAGLDYIKRVGMRNIYLKEMELIRKFYREAEKNGRIITYTPYPQADVFSPVLSFNVAGKTSEETAGYLNERNIAVRAGFHCSLCAHQKLNTTDVGTVRISPSIQNNEKEIEFLINILKKIK